MRRNSASRALSQIQKMSTPNRATFIFKGTTPLWEEDRKGRPLVRTFWPGQYLGHYFDIGCISRRAGASGRDGNRDRQHHQSWLDDWRWHRMGAFRTLDRKSRVPYVDLGTVNNAFAFTGLAGGAFATAATSSRISDNTFRAGVNYRLSGLLRSTINKQEREARAICMGLFVHVR